MPKRIFIVHGWDGYPEYGWFPWLKHELERRECQVLIPQLPNPSEPRIESWVPALAQAVGTPDTETYFVGHSMGCQTIARYLESLGEDVRVGGAVFVAGFLKRLTGIEEEGPEVVEIAREWLETPLDVEKVKSRLPNSVALFSDDDPYVPLDNQDDFRDKLGSRIIVEHARGHYSGPRDHMTEAPSILEAVLNIVAAQ